MESCKNIKDVSPLADCLELEAVAFPMSVVGVESLRKLPKGRRIGWRWTGSYDDFDFAPPAAEFWKEYDEREKVVGPILALLPKLGLKDYADRVSIEAPWGACLKLNDSAVTDVSSIASLPINVLHIARTKVRDLSPLRRMRLTILTCDNTAV